MYITKSDLEAYLWIQFEEWDTTPDTLIGWVESAVNSYIWANWENWILVSDYEEKIDVRSIILNEDWYNIYLSNSPVVEDNQITINWTTLSYEENPYQIVRWRQLIVKKLEAIRDETSPFTTRNRITVGYRAWYWTRDEETKSYTNIPEDIKLVCLYVCSVLRITKDYVGMTNYRLWDESISLWRRNYLYWNPIVSETLKKYRKIYIAY